MNKKIIIITAGIVVLISSAIAYVAIQPSSPKNQSMDENMATKKQVEATDTATPAEVEGAAESQQEVTTPPATNNTSTATPGQYVAYSQQSVTATKGTKLLFFHAPWCSQCRQIEATMQSDGIPSGVTVFKIDYDSNQQLRQQYGVTLQTTFVKIDDSGAKVASYVAYDEPVFASVRRELLR